MLLFSFQVADGRSFFPCYGDVKEKCIWFMLEAESEEAAVEDG